MMTCNGILHKSSNNKFFFFKNIIITIILLLGVEYPAVVEYAPYQAVPKKKVKKDPKIGTILEGV